MGQPHGMPPQGQPPQGQPPLGMPPQGQPQGMPPQGRPLPPPGFLLLHLQGNMMLSMITPTVRVDGQVVGAKYGENRIPVVPGQHRLDINAQWMWTYGQAGTEFAVREGETAELWYAAPMLTWIKGNLGPEKQKHPGLVGMIAFLTLVIVVPILVIVLIALASG